MTKLYKSPCYCTNLRRSANAVSAFYNDALNAVGLSASQYYLLINLSRMGSANITHWAARVGLDRSTMVRNCKPMKRGGLIAMTAGSGKTYTLTDRGRAALEAAIPLWDKRQAELVSFLGAEDAAAILRIGDKLQGLMPE